MHFILESLTLGAQCIGKVEHYSLIMATEGYTRRDRTVAQGEKSVRS